MKEDDDDDEISGTFSGAGADAAGAVGADNAAPTDSSPSPPPPFLREKHREHILKISRDRESLDYVMTEHLRLSGVYWALMGMSLLGFDAEEEMGGGGELVEWILDCGRGGEGGFGGAPGHDPHILYTLSAIQCLALLGKLDLIDKEKVAAYVCNLQQPDGSFFGDRWGEVDTRFSYCALSAMSLLGLLKEGRCTSSSANATLDVDKAVEFIASCSNFDGGFGCVPGAESHAGQVFTSVGALSIAHRLDVVDADLLGWWLAERQCDSGGLNGRPEKQADVCYSWWILSALSILDRVDWLDAARLVSFVLDSQDDEEGGIAERPAHCSDVFHTFFGIAGLSLLGFLNPDEGYREVDPAYALPKFLTQELGLTSERLILKAHAGHSVEK